jgi:large subunit ribosomal protein L29
MNITELRAKSKDELKEIIISSKKEQFNLRMQESTGALENKSGFKAARRTIARAKTLLNEGALLNEKPNANAKAKAPAAKKAPAKKAKKG